MSDRPVVTVIVPARDEAADIQRCLDHVAAQDYPLELLEVVVIDGCSTDGTAELAERSLAAVPFKSVAVIDNPGATTPSNLNVGLASATGEIVCRVDARTLIEPHYIRTCVEVLTTRPAVATVGGAQVAVARGGSASTVGIARALNNRWTMGGSRYRRASRSGEADTVYLGAFRRSDLEEIGGWDERLASNQDFDLNRRMAARGTVWFEGSLRSGYLPRESLGALWAQYRRFGRAKVTYWRTTGDRPQSRQWMLMTGPPLTGGIGLAVLVLAPAPVRVACAGAVIGALSAVEIVGADGPPGAVGAHLVSGCSIVLIGAGWLLGVAEGLLEAAAPGYRSARMRVGPSEPAP